MTAGQDLGGVAASDVVVSGRALAGAADRSDVVIPLPLRVGAGATSVSSPQDVLAERAVLLVLSRIAGFRRTEMHPPTLREIVAIAVEAVLDQQALDRLMAALNEQETMP